ncbi:glycoside hydrolase [Novosphingobium flavum]|uniref:Glycoside hydrolase n=1 Tax=Novosphingobium aerophilum TaxID=2839843 RepID=A0A7X1F6W3_9SPHN|nr:glycosyl hydrolase [Novosphingobium aerophilum]MBC2651149.1 glycoside hydrolase [Novosphingobium aerophilum]MBC2660706.1 glycoside hydrolase [Novosphingobium aerophilum]
MKTTKTFLAALLLGTTALVGATSARAAEAASADPSLEALFRDPPQSARPRVWWHWMNGNVTKDGIAKDLAWMKAVGIGGMQTFDANLQTPQIVDRRLVYMTPEWKEAFRFAASEADRLGLELAIAASPGWSETGGPWVKPQDAMKKLVWSSVDLAPGASPGAALPAPPQRTGPFQDVAPGRSIEELISGKPAPEAATFYGDVRVLAFPVPTPVPLVPVSAVDSLGNPLKAPVLAGAGPEPVVLGRKEGVAPGLTLDFGKPVTARAATLFLPDLSVPFFGVTYKARLEASADGAEWRKVAHVTLAAIPTTVSFAAVNARQFRVILEPVPPRTSLGAPVPGLVMAPFEQSIGGFYSQRPLEVRTFQLAGDPAVDQFQTKAGFAMSPDYYALGQIEDGARGIDPAQVVDLTGKLRADGTLDWRAPRLPQGQVWRVLRLGYSLLGTTNHPATPEATGLEVDKYDGTAVRGYLDHYLGLYKDAAGPELVGKRGVRALLTDSIEVGEANWTPRMVEQFQRLRGYDPLPWLPALTGTLVGTRAESDRFLFDYRRTLADLLASEHYGTVARVAHENDLTVYGEALEDHRPMLGDDMAMRRHADVPMAALWTFNRQEGPRQTLIADMKGAASVAHVYGQNLVAAESMTAAMAPWAFAPKDLKRFIDLEFVTGVNRPVIHTSVHVPVDDKAPGLSLFIFGQYFNRMESWAGLAKPWVDYIARSSLLLQWGRNHADLAYFHGEEAPLTGLYGDTPVADAPRGYAYDFLNFDALTGQLANDGADVVTPAGARYRAIYLGGTSRMMTLAALRRLAGLVEGGATVIGRPPLADPGRAGDDAAFAALVARLWPGGAGATVGRGRTLIAPDAEAGLAGLGLAPDFAFTGGSAQADIPFVHRTSGDEHVYYLTNRGPAAETIEARFRVAGRVPELWHAETGTSEPVSYRIVGGETIVPLSLAVDDAVFVVFRKPATEATRQVPVVSARPLLALDEGWSLAFQPGRGAPATLALPRLIPLQTHAEPGVKHFSGTVTYSRSVTLPKRGRAAGPLWLDLGEVGDLARVSVNGVEVGTVWHAPYRIDIGAAVRPGVNRLDILVANTWVNRLVGDAQPGAKPLTWTALPTYRADAPLRPSGLIGPVRLLEAGNPAIERK